MVEIILIFVTLYLVVALSLFLLDLYFGYSAGYDLDWQFILHSFIGSIIWPCGAAALWIMNFKNRKK